MTLELQSSFSSVFATWFSRLVVLLYSQIYCHANFLLVDFESNSGIHVFAFIFFFREPRTWKLQTLLSVVSKLYFVVCGYIYRKKMMLVSFSWHWKRILNKKIFFKVECKEIPTGKCYHTSYTRYCVFLLLLLHIKYWEVWLTNFQVLVARGFCPASINF